MHLGTSEQRCCVQRVDYVEFFEDEFFVELCWPQCGKYSVSDMLSVFARLVGAALLYYKSNARSTAYLYNILTADCSVE